MIGGGGGERATSTSSSARRLLSSQCCFFLLLSFKPPSHISPPKNKRIKALFVSSAPRERESILQLSLGAVARATGACGPRGSRRHLLEKSADSRRRPKKEKKARHHRAADVVKTNKKRTTHLQEETRPRACSRRSFRSSLYSILYISIILFFI